MQKSTGTILYVIDYHPNIGTFLYVQNRTGIFLYVQNRTVTFLYGISSVILKTDAPTFVLISHLKVNENPWNFYHAFLTCSTLFLQNFNILRCHLTSLFTSKDGRLYRESDKKWHTESYRYFFVRTKKYRYDSVRTKKYRYFHGQNKHTKSYRYFFVRTEKYRYYYVRTEKYRYDFVIQKSSYFSARSTKMASVSG